MPRTAAAAASRRGDTSTPASSDLHLAAANCNPSFVAHALRNGQAVDSFFQGVTPLHAAASCGDEACVKLLLAHGANVNAARAQANVTLGRKPRDWDVASQMHQPGAPGSTPLHFAAANGHLSVVRTLLQYGASPVSFDQALMSPESLASANGHHEVVELIRTWARSFGNKGPLVGTPYNTDPQNVSIMQQHAAAALSLQLQSASPRRAQPASLPGLQAQGSFDHSSTGVKARFRTTKEAILGKPSSHPDLKADFLSRAMSPYFLMPPDPLLHHTTPEGTSALRATGGETSASTNLRPSFNTTSLDLERSSSAIGERALMYEEDVDIGFAISRTPMPRELSTSTLSHSSRRRPSLPSILGRPPLPGGSLRNALLSGASSESLKHSVITNSVRRSPLMAHTSENSLRAPNQSSLINKRSFSGFLCKVTGSGHELVVSFASYNAGCSRPDLLDNKDEMSRLVSVISNTATSPNIPLDL